jgi:peptide chain release factor 1
LGSRCSSFSSLVTSFRDRRARSAIKPSRRKEGETSWESSSRSAPPRAARTRNRSSADSSGSTSASPRSAVFDAVEIERSPGFAALRITGADAFDAFRDEAGGHRWQRVPPNDRRGRVHTSTITVAVLPEPEDFELRIDPRDLEWRTTRGSGAGGQHRNVTESAIDLVHRPTGVSVHVESERSQHQNRAIALARLRARLGADERAKNDRARRDDRRAQVGSGMRGDKRRTIRAQDGTVVDHLTGRTWRLRDYERGEL